MPPTFGKRVVGAEAYLKAVETHEGGLEVFGKRVAGAIAQPTAEQVAKGASQFGARVVEDAQYQDHRGEKTDIMAIEDLQELLNENPTFFDTFYEAEMAKAGGPRKEALNIFKVVEQGIKGAGRQHIIDEINGHLGVPEARAKQAADENRKRIENYKAMEARGVENRALLESEKIAQLATREENIEKIRKSKSPTVKAAVEELDRAEEIAEGEDKPKAGADKREAAGESLPVDTDESGGGMAGAGKGAKEGSKGGKKGKK